MEPFGVRNLLKNNASHNATKHIAKLLQANAEYKNC